MTAAREDPLGLPYRRYPVSESDCSGVGPAFSDLCPDHAANSDAQPCRYEPHNRETAAYAQRRLIDNVHPERDPFR